MNPAPPAPGSRAPRPHLFNQTPESLAELFEGWDLPRYRAGQVLDWVYAKGVADPREMTNLSRSNRELIADRLEVLRGTIIRHQRATDGTQKLLVDWGVAAGRGALAAGEQDRVNPTATPLPILSPSLKPATSDPRPATSHQTESVMIPSGPRKHEPLTSGSRASPPPHQRPRRTACISSQVGCPVGCAFCASGLGGLDANLTPGQIVQQAWQLSWQLEDEREGGQRLTNIVFMGMGEPLANLRGVLPALRTLTAPWGMNLAARRITVSTVGVPAGIRRLADLDLQVTLAISLHAPNDALRQRIIPWAKRVSIDDLIAAGREYFNRTGREVTLEYILLAGVNDRPEHARELAAVAKKLRSNVNLIRYNEVAGLPFGRPDDADVHRFQALLRQANINTHLRASRGRDIAAACGQLRHEAAQGQAQR